MNIKQLMVALFVLLSVMPSFAKSTNKYPDWTKKSHSNEVKPNYDEVFSANKIRRMDITISSSNWETIWSDIANNLGAGDFAMGRGAANTTTDIELQWVPCNITYEGREWYEVGVRFKGNSSLMRSTREGVKKLSMKLDFDEYEDQYPELKNQRFYGFKQLNLNCNFNDTSFIRETIATKLFREFGLVASATSFCEIYIDYGEGPQYYGLYTIVEEVDDSLIKSSFKDDSGNVYKPEERAGSFAEGTFNTSQFYYKGNDDNHDYSDVKALYDVLNSSKRESNQEAWKSDLEEIFDVDTFLKWLAATSAIQNWDTYGNMAHNYYLYNDPSTKKLVWIPWDHNEAFTGGRNSYEPDQLPNVNSSWPLISYLISVDEYKSKFDGYLREFVDRVFAPSRMITQYENFYDLLKESVYGELTLRTYMRYYKQFDESIESLKEHVISRNEVINNYLQ